MADTPDLRAASRGDTLAQVAQTIARPPARFRFGFFPVPLLLNGLFRMSGPAPGDCVRGDYAAGSVSVRAGTPGLLGSPPSGCRQSGCIGPLELLRDASRKRVSSRPVLWIVLIIGLMLPLTVYGFSTTVSYDLLGDLPDDDPAVVGYAIVRDNFGAGRLLRRSTSLSWTKPGGGSG